MARRSAVTPELRALVAELYERERSYRRVAKILSEANVPTPGRGVLGWQATTVARILAKRASDY